MPSLLEKLFLIFCFFPYLQIFPLGIDSQPYALVLGTLILMTRRVTLIKMKLPIFFLFIICVVGILCIFFSPIDFNSFRSAINYISLFVIPLASIIALKRKNLLSLSFFKKVVYTWLIFGIIQQFFFPSFGSIFLGRMTTGYGRGVTSLAPEPTFYAIICVLLSIICFLNFRHQKEYKKIQVIIWIQIVLLSRSTMVIFLAIISVFIYKLLYAIKFRPKIVFRVFLSLVLLYLVTPLVLPYIQNFRIGSLLMILMENPEIFIIRDESVNERFIHAFFPIYGFIDNWGLPHFYGYFNEYMRNIWEEGTFIDLMPTYRSDYDRIMSGFGSIMFELGVISLLLFYVIFRCSRKIIRYKAVFLFYTVIFCFILFNAMPFSNALIGFVIGNVIYNSDIYMSNDYILKIGTVNRKY